MKKFFFISQAILLVSFFSLMANNSRKVNYDPYGELQGKIADAATKEGIPFAAIVLLKDSVQVAGCVADLDGYYIIKPLAPGTYSLKVSMVGYASVTIARVTIDADKLTFQNIILNKATDESGKIMALNETSSRSNPPVYYVDGMPLQCDINFPFSKIEQLYINTGNIPARYQNEVEEENDKMLFLLFKMNNQPRVSICGMGHSEK